MAANLVLVREGVLCVQPRRANRGPFFQQINEVSSFQSALRTQKANNGKKEQQYKFPYQCDELKHKFLTLLPRVCCAVHQCAVHMQREDRCLWFGVPGHCSVYSVLLPSLVVCSLGDLFVSLGMMALGSESSETTKGKRKCAFRPLAMHHILQCLLCLHLHSSYVTVVTSSVQSAYS